MSSQVIERVFEDIKSMRIRGAGRIARAAAGALREYAETLSASSARELYSKLEAAGEKLKSARPTAVSLPNSVNYVLMRARRELERGGSSEEVRTAAIRAASEFIERSLKAVETIGEIGSRRIVDGDVLLTHCNSEAAISVILTAYKQGKSISVYVTETRPRFQGRITASILARNGVDVTLIPDSAARLYMRRIDKVVVGADAIAANGAVVNKIGTAQIALAAKESRTRVFVAAETYKLSPSTMLGELVEIEERSPLEVVSEEWLRENPGVKVKNPAFDVTPPDYIDVIITELGVYPPQGIILLLRELYPEPGGLFSTPASSKIEAED